MRRPAALPVLCVLTATLALASCAGGTSSGGSTPGGTSADGEATSGTLASPSGTDAAYAPFEADNCGTTVTREDAPERIVTVKSAMTDLVLALGVGDRLVGTAYQDGTPDPADPITSGEVATGTAQDSAAILAAVPALGDRMPSHEAVLSVEPDLLLAGWESTFAADAAGERSSFADLGITTFVAPSACTQAPYTPDPLTWDDVFGEVEQVGALLGRTSEADALVDRLDADLASVEQDVQADNAGAEPSDGPTALWWSSGTDTPFVGAGAGAPQLVMETAGLLNVAVDLPGGWGPYSWEAAAAADPDVIVLVDSVWNSAEKKKAFLAENPVTSAMTAVQQQRYLVVPFAATEAGVRNVEAVTTLHEQLTALDTQPQQG